MIDYTNVTSLEAIEMEIETHSDTVKRMEKLELIEALKEYSQVRDYFEELTKQSKAMGVVYKEATQRVLPELFDEEDVSSVSVNGYRYTSTAKLRTSIIADKKDEAFDWLRENQMGDLITQNVNVQTLSAAARDMLEDDGMTLDPDFFKGYYQKNISRTKVK